MRSIEYVRKSAKTTTNMYLCSDCHFLQKLYDFIERKSTSLFNDSEQGRSSTLVFLNEIVETGSVQLTVGITVLETALAVC